MFVEKTNKEGIIVWRVDKTNKIYEYLVRKDASQYSTIKKIVFRGFTRKPTSFNDNGYGFARGLKPLYYTLKDTFNSISCIYIEPNIKNSIKKSGKSVKIYFNKNDYEAILSNLTELYRENSARLSLTSKELLHDTFGKKFFPSISSTSYKKNTIKNILSDDEILDKMSVEDIKAIARKIPDLIEKSYEIKQQILNKLLFVDLKKKVNSIELEKVIEEYDKLLKKKKQDENEWQQYFRRNLLLLNPGYISIIEKKNISINISIPDFLLLDQFQYLDVFEIKRPDHKPLNYDKSHDNYYWSAETSKAISQTEKYIFNLENQSNAIINSFADEGIELKIIRPKGVVIIGKREDYEKNKKALKSFRVLNEAMHNINVIFFDDYLQMFKMRYSQLSK